jgi:hypothetical protein
MSGMLFLQAGGARRFSVQSAFMRITNKQTNKQTVVNVRLTASRHVEPSSVFVLSDIERNDFSVTHLKFKTLFDQNVAPNFQRQPFT